MLNIDLKRIFAIRGIAYPYKSLVKLGISPATAWNLLNRNTTQIKSKHLELICELLSCEPNDIYSWSPSTPLQNAATHPLKALRRDNSAADFQKMIRKIPLDQIERVKELLAEASVEE